MLFYAYQVAFKHSNVEDKSVGYIKIDLKLEHNKLTFNVKNSVARSAQKDKTGGVGLDNVKRRLELLFPKSKGNQYDLKVTATDLEYEVVLKLDLK